MTVNVVNKNDEAPVFTVNEYYGSVTEELDGSPVFVLQVNTNHQSVFICMIKAHVAAIQFDVFPGFQV